MGYCQDLTPGDDFRFDLLAPRVREDLPQYCAPTTRRRAGLIFFGGSP